MKHLHEGDTPLLAQLEPGHSRQPVVRMDHVVVDALGPAMRLDTLDELGQMRVNRGPPDGGVGPRGQMDDPRAFPEIGHAGNRRILGAREDVDGHPHAGELPRRLAHVHVHAPRLLAPEGSEGAGVDAEHRDAKAHGVTRTRKRSWGVGPKAYL